MLSTSLPAEGLLLRPQQYEGETGQSGLTRSEGGMLNTSHQDDSSDDEDLESGVIAEDSAATGTQ